MFALLMLIFAVVVLASIDQRYTGRVGRQVFITFEDGIEVPLTGHCTCDTEADHMKVAQAAAEFYNLPERPALVKAPA